MNIVAHEDDDILFMNPAIQQELDAGLCMQTVYVTAGDAGWGSSYWMEREQGPDAAYATMAGLSAAWQPTAVTISGHTLAARTSPDRPRLTLIFLRLPDGNLAGQGFDATGYNSLQKLRTGEISSIQAIDESSEYTDADLVNTLRGLMHTYKPSIIHIPANSPELAPGDHSDHQTVGYYADRAAKSYYRSVQTHHYVGYQAGWMSNNLTDDQLLSKQTVFHAYVGHDKLICGADACANGTGYEQYFGKQYEESQLSL